jgi:hypothetical protein
MSIEKPSIRVTGSLHLQFKDLQSVFTIYVMSVLGMVIKNACIYQKSFIFCQGQPAPGGVLKHLVAQAPQQLGY